MGAKKISTDIATKSGLSTGYSPQKRNTGWPQNQRGGHRRASKTYGGAGSTTSSAQRSCVLAGKNVKQYVPDQAENVEEERLSRWRRTMRQTASSLTTGRKTAITKKISEAGALSRPPSAGRNGAQRPPGSQRLVAYRPLSCGGEICHSAQHDSTAPLLYGLRRYQQDAEEPGGGERWTPSGRQATSRDGCPQGRPCIGGKMGMCGMESGHGGLPARSK